MCCNKKKVHLESTKIKQWMQVTDREQIKIVLLTIKNKTKTKLSIQVFPIKAVVRYRYIYICFEKRNKSSLANKM